MKTRKLVTAAVAAFSIGCISCHNNDDDNKQNPVSDDNLSVPCGLDEKSLMDDYGALLRNRINASGPCAMVDYERILSEYTTSQDAFSQKHSNELNTLMKIYTILVDDPQPYFGPNGEYTTLMQHREKELRDFWNFEEPIIVRGQHNSFYGDREKLITAYMRCQYSNKDDAARQADVIVRKYNEAASSLGSPLFSMDAFMQEINDKRLIVIGDGFVQILSEAGVEPGIGWTGIIAHEWAHHVQSKGKYWDPESGNSTPEVARYTELGADFMAAYFMSHSKGIQYQWSDEVDFFDLFFQIGDCNFTSPLHHGTSQQRMAAARMGYRIAKDIVGTTPLTQAEVLDLFDILSATIIEGNAPQLKRASLHRFTPAETRAYNKALQYADEIKGISAGTINPKTLAN